MKLSKNNRASLTYLSLKGVNVKVKRIETVVTHLLLSPQ